MGSGKNGIATPSGTRLLSDFCVLLVADPNSDCGVADPTPESEGPEVRMLQVASACTPARGTRSGYAHEDCR